MNKIINLKEEMKGLPVELVAIIANYVIQLHTSEIQKVTQNIKELTIKTNIQMENCLWSPKFTDVMVRWADFVDPLGSYSCWPGAYPPE